MERGDAGEVTGGLTASPSLGYVLLCVRLTLECFRAPVASAVASRVSKPSEGTCK